MLGQHMSVWGSHMRALPGWLCWQVCCCTSTAHCHAHSMLIICSTAAACLRAVSVSGARLCGHDGGDVLIRQLLEDGALASIVQAQHEDACLCTGTHRRGMGVGVQSDCVSACHCCWCAVGSGSTHDCFAAAANGQVVLSSTRDACW